VSGSLDTQEGSGNGQACDPINRLGSWGHNAGFIDTDTIAASSLTSRFDLLWETAAVRSMPATYHAFGNNGSVPLDQGVDAPANTALADLPNRLAVLHDLAQVCSDHLPVVQNYRITAPASVISGMPFDVTVVAVDRFGNVDTNYQGAVAFSTSDTDPGVMLPADYTFPAERWRYGDLRERCDADHAWR
jgi:hypothetical protein